MVKNIFTTVVDKQKEDKIKSSLLKMSFINECAVFQYKNNKEKLAVFIVTNSTFNKQKRILEVLQSLQIEDYKADAAITAETIDSYHSILEEAIVSSVYIEFKRHNIFGKQGEWVNRNYIEKNLVIKNNYKLILTKWLNIFTDKGYLKKNGGLYLDNEYEKDTTKLWEQLKTEPFSLIMPESVCNYIQNHTDNICHLFSGQCTPLNFLFPQGQTVVAEDLYGGTAILYYLNNILADIVYEFSKDKYIKILEVGGGVGATTKKIIEKINKSSFDYLFTDFSLFFLNNIKKDYPFIQTKLLDLNNIELSVDDDLYDVIVAAGVLNSTKNIAQTINNLLTLLKDDGIFLFTEPIAAHIEIDVTQNFMMLQYEDSRKNTEQWYLSEGTWKEELDKLGLEVLKIFPSEKDDYRKFNQNLYVVCKSCGKEQSNFQEFIKKQLATTVIPKEYYFVDHIPLTEEGNIDTTSVNINYQINLD